MAAASDFPLREGPGAAARHSRSHWSPAAFSFGGAQRYTDYAPRDEERAPPRSWVSLYAIGGLASFSFLLAAYLISHRDVREPTPGAQVVEGSVLGPKDTAALPLARPPASHSAPALVAHVRPPAVVHVQPSPVAQVQVPPVGRAQASVPQGVAVRAGSYEEHAFVAKANAPKTVTSAVTSAGTSARADVGRNLASARASLDKDSLGPARKAIMTALADQPNNGYALQMQAELVSREQQRDSLLGYARLCAREGQWVCAWHNAGHALTIDASSSDAREMLARSIAEQGRTTTRQVDSGPPGPPIDDQ